jgi:hypothetical protein
MVLRRQLQPGSAFNFLPEVTWKHAMLMLPFQPGAAGRITLQHEHLRTLCLRRWYSSPPQACCGVCHASAWVQAAQQCSLLSTGRYSPARSSVADERQLRISAGRGRVRLQHLRDPACTGCARIAARTGLCVLLVALLMTSASFGCVSCCTATAFVGR